MTPQPITAYNTMAEPQFTKAYNTYGRLPYLRPIQTNYPVDIPCAIIKIGHSNCMFAGRNPVLLCVWINLEDMGFGAKDGLLSGKKR